MAEQKTNRATKVEILGSEYRLTGDDEAYLHQLANFVDNKLRECSDGKLVYSSGRLGILTCLNIADQLFKMEKDQKEFMTHTLEFVTNSIDKIDNVLDYISHETNLSKTELTETIYTKN
jgi:cell division protein ZapA